MRGSPQSAGIREAGAESSGHQSTAHHSTSRQSAGSRSGGGASAADSPSRNDGAARATLLFAALFLVLLAAVHVMTPELDPATRPISEYALGAHGWLMTLAFLAWSASTASVMWTLRAHVRSRAGVAGLLFLGIGAAGPLLAALFPMDPFTTPVAEATASGGIHNMAAMLGDGIPIGALMLTISLLRKNPSWRPAAWPLILTLLAAWTGVIVMTAMLASYLASSGGQFGPNAALGWPARFMVVAYMSWIGVAALAAARIDSGRDR